VPALSPSSLSTVRSYLQGRSLTHFRTFEPGYWREPNFVLGVAAFFIGMGINLHSDTVLLRLRKGPDDKGYYIPTGGMFHYVSGANFFGEILEWAGWALATWSLPAAAFALFTFCNIGPRGAQHHAWYKSKFGDKYPRRRKAVIPWLW
jgi:3-oxo-5-alpha-steroid 4-dehydrogenase 1